MTPDEMRRAADLLSADEIADQLIDAMVGNDGMQTMLRERSDLARKLRAEAEGRGWRSMDTAPKNCLVLLAVDADGERKTFAAEMAIDKYGELHWMITTGWTGWTRLHSAWTPIGWQPLPPGPEAT